MIDTETRRHLLSLHPGLQRYAAGMLQASAEAGIPLRIISGRRSADINRLVGGAVNSLHLRGLAFDVQVGNWRRDQVPGWLWAALGQWWESLGGRWGGRFFPPDANHFDAGLSA